MGIHDEDIAKVRASADLVQLIGEHTEIKRSGRSWMARCPLHGERTPSLSVSPEKGVYYCFGCQRSGDAISFVQEIDNLDFVGAVESLAGRYGVTLRYTSQNEGATRARKRSLLDAVEKAVHFYHDRLLTSADAGEARGYLRSRGYDGELVRTYRIGWAPDDWDQLARRLKLKDDDLRDSGLGFVNKAGRQQDSFRGRVMFPITDERGDAVGFGGRILPGHEGSKYKNTSTESSVYDKSKILYGLHTHRDGIVKAGEAIICEGYTDVIGYATGGIPRAVATCGTALTEDHVKLLKRFSADRVILSFDADAAGIAAAERVYTWEREYELDIRVAALPDGIDPDDLAREDPEALQRAVDEAMPFLKFRLERALAAGDLSTVEGRARTAEHALDVVSEHPDPLVRDPYVIEIADRCRLDVVRLRELLAGERSSVMPKRARVDPDAPLSQPTRLTPEDEAIRVAIHRPTEVVGLLSAGLFADPIRREAFEVLAEDGLVAAADRAGPEAGTLLRRLAVEAGEADADDVLAGLARLAGDRVMRDLQRSARMAEGMEQRRGYADAIQWVKSQLELLTESNTREAAVAQLLPWLIEQAEGRGL
ncbi:MAG: DNA primase [Acidimicrobiaceae bacterium]|jgi:DNA primase|nr:DNA primase [Acidimicrobiaceae bacterium]MBT5581164.1 DNA primase [Acidimicrobiaceae bacterium]MBT5849559.1 DNA primase [Acidimicrobiaceae bacterium]